MLFELHITAENILITIRGYTQNLDLAVAIRHIIQLVYEVHTHGRNNLSKTRVEFRHHNQLPDIATFAIRGFGLRYSSKNSKLFKKASYIAQEALVLSNQSSKVLHRLIITSCIKQTSDPARFLTRITSKDLLGYACVKIQQSPIASFEAIIIHQMVEPIHFRLRQGNMQHIARLKISGRNALDGHKLTSLSSPLVTLNQEFMGRITNDTSTASHFNFDGFHVFARLLEDYIPGPSLPSPDSHRGVNNLNHTPIPIICKNHGISSNRSVPQVFTPVRANID